MNKSHGKGSVRNFWEICTVRKIRPEILRMALGTFRVYQANTNTDGTLRQRYEVATINGCHIPYLGCVFG